MTQQTQMTRWLSRWGILSGAVAFALLAMVAIYTVVSYREFARLELHTNEVIAKIRQIEAWMERAETSQRGYLITKKVAYLAPYHTVLASIDADIHELQSLIADNPAQVRRTDELRTLVKKRLEKMQSVIDSSAQKPLATLAPTIDLELMADLRNTAAVLEQEELRLLSHRREHANWFSRLSVLLLGFGGFLALILMGFSVWIVNSSARRNLEQTNLITQVFDSMTEGVIVIDKNLRVIHSNRASNEMSEVSLVGKSLAEFYALTRPLKPDQTDADLDYHQSALYRALHGETVLRFEVEFGRRHRRFVSVDARSVRGENGEITAAFCTFHDITQRRETEEQWRNAREAALEASRLKSDFLATMSHEIRTPMNGVMGMATLLMETPLNREQESYVRTIKGSADALLSLINQVLDHSKIESGKLHLDETDFELAGVVDNVLSLFRYLARSKNVELNAKIETDVPTVVVGDANRLRQILLNLVGNALKFIERGSVEVLVRARGDLLEFSVKDTGPGIAPDKQSQLFQKFSQVHDSKSVRAAGSGLGLMISRELVRVMGGDMGVESAVGVGSRFWFTARFKPSLNAAVCEWQPQEGREKLRGRVLVAEDQPVNQMVVRKFLETFGLEYEIVDEGGAAVKLAREGHFDLILMDCRMLPMDGYEATRQIREFNPSIPILALTAEGISGERQLCLDAGMNEVLTKPIDVDRLHQALKTHLQKPEFEEARLAKLADYDSDGRPLLDVLVEDFLSNGLQLERSLKDHWSSGEVEKMKYFAHALRSPAATLGLLSLAEICAEIEDGPGPVPAAKIENLEIVFKRAQDWLKQRSRVTKAS